MGVAGFQLVFLVMKRRDLAHRLSSTVHCFFLTIDSTLGENHPLFISIKSWNVNRNHVENVYRQFDRSCESYRGSAHKDLKYLAFLLRVSSYLFSPTVLKSAAVLVTKRSAKALLHEDLSTLR